MGGDDDDEDEDDDDEDDDDDDEDGGGDGRTIQYLLNTNIVTSSPVSPTHLLLQVRWGS